MNAVSEQRVREDGEDRGTMRCSEEWDEFDEFRQRSYSAGVDLRRPRHRARSSPLRHASLRPRRRPPAPHTTPTTTTTEPGLLSSVHDSSPDFDDGTDDILLLERMVRLRLMDKCEPQQNCNDVDDEMRVSGTPDNVLQPGDQEGWTELHDNRLSTSHTHLSSSHNHLSTSQNHLSTSHNHLSTSHNHLSTSHNHLSTSPDPALVRNGQLSSSLRQCPSKRPGYLDVTRDSTAHRRTLSMPTKRRQPRQNPPGDEPRSSSNEDDDEYVRVRTFSTSSKGIISRGNSLKRKFPVSGRSSPGLGVVEDWDRARPWSGTSSQGSSVTSGTSPTPRQYRVIVLGSDGVGKSSIIKQFTSQESPRHTDVSFDGSDSGVVTVLLDGDQCVMELVHFTPTINPDDMPTGDAYAIVFSVADQDTFDDAVDILFELRKRRVQEQHAVILVANKRDIVRQRVVSEEDAKVMAVRYEAKYIEVSAVLNHNTDDLFVGILKQIRLRESRHNRRTNRKLMGHSAAVSNDGCLDLCSNSGLVGKLFKRHPMLKSCEQLFSD